jgi:hypothetical protein
MPRIRAAAVRFPLLACSVDRSSCRSYSSSAPASVFEVPAEAGQTDIDGVEHHLNGDEHQDDVAPGKEAEYANPKEDSAQS